MSAAAEASSPPAASSASASPALSRNQQLKRARRQRSRERRDSSLHSALQEDPLCQRLLAAQAHFQHELQRRFRQAALTTNSDDGADEESDAKRRKCDSTAASAVAATAGASVDAAAASAGPSCSLRCSSSATLARHAVHGVVLDQAAQIQASYTAHELARSGEFTRRGADGQATRFTHADDADLFSLPKPYQLTAAPSAAAASTSSDNTDTLSVIANAEPAVLRNSSDIDSEVEFAGLLHVLPPRSTALVSDIRHAPAQLLSVRPVDGFRLIVMDPPWESKSVRRSQRYSCLDHRELLTLPIDQLLAQQGDSYVAVWVTNNPLFSSFVVGELFPAWRVEHVATWHWLKVCDDGEMVLPLHPAADSNHRKPYELLLIGQRRGATVSAHASDPTPAVGVASGEHASFLPDLTLLSVPGSKQHSRKPQLGDLFSSFLPPASSCLELFARNLAANWCSWGNEPLKYQRVAASPSAASSAAKK